MRVPIVSHTQSKGKAGDKSGKNKGMINLFMVIFTSAG